MTDYELPIAAGNRLLAIATKSRNTPDAEIPKDYRSTVKRLSSYAPPQATRRELIINLAQQHWMFEGIPDIECRFVFSCLP